MSRPMEYLTLPMILVLLGAILGAVGAFLATIRQNQEKVLSAIQRAQFESELRVKSDEIAALNRTIAESITGGDSYCYLELASPGPNSALITIIHQGSYPLYDVSIRMVELDAFERINKEVPKPTYETLKLSETILPVGNLSPGLASMMGSIRLPNPERIRYNIFISARNGMFVELLRMQNLEGVWKRAMRVERNNYSDTNPNAPPTILKEQIDAEFPRDKDGQVDW